VGLVTVKWWTTVRGYANRVVPHEVRLHAFSFPHAEVLARSASNRESKAVMEYKDRGEVTDRRWVD
jgi:hypothetical protein